MKYYLAFDDTDTIDCGRGTGKLARWFANELPLGFKQIMVVRQQLLHSPEVPMTSHNSALCCLIEGLDNAEALLVRKATAHIKNHFFEGSDPGLCVVAENEITDKIIEFGIKCTHSKVSQAEAIELAQNIHLSGHGGTNDGIIGALAAVGLTYIGDSGRIVDYADLRELPQHTKAEELRSRAIFPISVNRHAEYIADTDIVDNQESMRPHLFGKRLVVPLMAIGKNSWQTINEKKDYNN
ncbi:MAG: hypothetical protein PF517_06135 [Salinivirgaceae bacterium]|jgi:tRNA(Ile2) C34 agmatinyltransferase TiaS|nr:hypothetical protein [Salinivirgaceae bacterium]